MSDYATADRPGRVTLGGPGSALERVDTYDHRQRLTYRRYVNGSTLVAGYQYTYDAANREQQRVDVHRAGRANVTRYDDERVAVVEVLARPQLGSQSPWVAANGYGAGDARYTVTYESGEAVQDTLVEVLSEAADGDAAPVVAQDYQAYDTMGHALTIDGVNRSRDGAGNVTSIWSPNGTIGLTYDALSRLRRAVRTDGTVVEYTYRGDDVLVEREVTCGPSAVECVDSHRVYVYDGLLLLQEHELTTSPTLQAQYYYADEGDVPLAVDLRNGGTNQLERYFYVTDRMGTVTALVNASGAVMERVDYTLWGRPTVTAPDALRPVLSEVRSDGSGDLLLVFSEPVDPAVVSSSPTNVVVADATSGISVVSTPSGGGGVTFTPSAVELVGLAPYAYGAAYRVSLGALQVGASYSVTVNADLMQDAWMNTNVAQTMAFTYATAGTVVAQGAAVMSTAPVVMPRSQLGNSIGFQAHLFDWDVDLVLMRARVFDPHTGMFLQRDPAGYEESVNLYAGMRWDPVNLRDPTGMNTCDPLEVGEWQVSKIKYNDDGLATRLYISFESFGVRVDLPEPLDLSADGARGIVNDMQVSVAVYGALIDLAQARARACALQNDGPGAEAGLAYVQATSFNPVDMPRVATRAADALVSAGEGDYRRAARLGGPVAVQWVAGAALTYATTKATTPIRRRFPVVDETPQGPGRLVS